MSRQLLTDRPPSRMDDATDVNVLFKDLMTQHQTMEEESRSRVVSNPIRTLSSKLGVQIVADDVRVVTRRSPKLAAADPARGG